MKDESGVVVLAAIFVGLFALLAGLVGGTIFGAKAVLKNNVPAIGTSALDKSGQDLSINMIDQMSRDLKRCQDRVTACTGT